MLQYRDIGPEDFQRYWGSGIVVMRHEGVWKGFQARVRPNDAVQLTLDNNMYGRQPGNSINMSQEEFFYKVMLHRPPLGVVVNDAGAVISLCWRIADGTPRKSIVHSDLVCTIIKRGDRECTPITDLPAILAAHQALVSCCFTRGIETNHRLVRNARHLLEVALKANALRAGDQESLALGLANFLEYLNIPSHTYATVIEAFKTRKVVALGNTLWLERTKDNVANLYNDTVLCGTVELKQGGQYVRNPELQTMHQHIADHSYKYLKSLEFFNSTTGE